MLLFSWRESSALTYLSCPSLGNVGEITAYSLESIFALFPNMREIDLSHLQVSGALAVSPGFPHVKRVTWNHLDRAMYLSGSCLPRTLLELFVDGSCFLSARESRDATQRVYESPGTASLLGSCIHLERLSIKDATFCCRFTPAEIKFPVTQNMLIEMVRNLVSLKWLRSDLTPENIAMLQQERSDITFVSE